MAATDPPLAQQIQAAQQALNQAIEQGIQNPNQQNQALVQQRQRELRNLQAQEPGSKVVPLDFQRASMGMSFQ